MHLNSLAKLAGATWCISESALQALVANFGELLAKAQAAPVTTDEGLPLQKVGNVGIVHVHGILGGQRLGWLERALGFADTGKIAEAVRAVNADSKITAAVLHVDSPGGVVTAIPETARLIAESRLPFKAFVDGMGASAAYWLSAGARGGVYATPSSPVGAIGVYSVLKDFSGAFAQNGIQVSVIRSGKWKGLGTPGAPITQEEKAHVQSEIDGIAEMFKAHLSDNRPKFSADIFDGGSFVGASAISKRLVDGNFDSFDAFLQQSVAGLGTGAGSQLTAGQMLRETFMALDPRRQADHIRGGGTVIDNPNPVTDGSEYPLPTFEAGATLPRSTFFELPVSQQGRFIRAGGLVTT